MGPHSVNDCHQGCWPVVSAVQRLNGQLPATHHEHRCDVHDARISAFCKSCELPLEPPRDQKPPTGGHGFVGCAGCEQIALVCPLGEAQGDDTLDERARHPASLVPA